MEVDRDAPDVEPEPVVDVVVVPVGSVIVVPEPPGSVSPPPMPPMIPWPLSVPEGLSGNNVAELAVEADWPIAELLPPLLPALGLVVLPCGAKTSE